MKKNKVIVLLAAILILSFSTFSAAGVIGSPHDLRGKTSFGNPQEVCKVCHIPHSATRGSHLNPAGRYFTSSNITVYGGTISQPANSSAVCLSCHDGILAPAVGTSKIDYSNSHPFSLVYPSKSGFAGAVGGKITGSNGTLPLEGTTQNRVECGTCHNPHEGGPSRNFLRIENTNSSLCLTCHQK